MSSKRLRTLEDVLNADPVGLLYAAIQKPLEDYRKDHPVQAAAEARAMEKLGQLHDADPTFDAKFKAIDQSTLNGKRHVCQILNITLDELRLLDEFEAGYAGIRLAQPDPDYLIRSWRALKQRAKIRDIDASNFPKSLTRPMLVLYSADWCPPCRKIRPTFARLVPFLDKADVRYCPDESLHKKLSPGGIPQFIAYFPDGMTRQSYVGSTAKAIWKTMNELVTPAEPPKDKGALLCDGDSCGIEPKK